MIVRAPYKDNGNGPYIGAVYIFTLQGETWTYDKKLTGIDAVFRYKFGDSVAISGDMLLIGDYYKDG